MGSDDPEDEQLRAATLKNAESIRIARQRAERELLAAKEALERKTAELEQQRQWFEVTLASIGDAVITTDVNAKISYLNPVAESTTGWSSKEAMGVPLDEVFRIVNEYTQQRIENPIGKVLQTGSVVGLANHTALIDKSGRVIPIEDSAAPIRAADGQIVGAVMVFHDVSDRRRDENALRDADRRKDEFLATLAHELRNPLAPIRQAALIFKAPTATEAQKRWSSDVISRQVQHMSLLLEDLLDISRITRGTLGLRPETVNLEEIVQAAIEPARPIIDAKRHSLSIELPTEPVHFMADPLRLAQVLSNLLTNAAKYTDPEGMLRLRAHCSGITLIISVIDNGIGLPPEATTSIFAMFSQIAASRDHSEGGLGIGLALAKGLVELHGGTIEAKSGGIGRGSEFIVRLPLRKAAVFPQHSVIESTCAQSVSRKVLIADDNHDAAESLAALLRMDGHAVTVVRNGHEALSAWSTYLPEVVLLDIGMPGLSGYEVARGVRKSDHGRAVVLIAITGWGQTRDKNEALAAGFDHHFTKPIDIDRLRELLGSAAPAAEVRP
jgi:PAS domain S-box-containing protein